MHRNVAESIVPGMLLHYDLDDLMIAIAPRNVSVVHSVNGSGDPLSEAAFRNQFARVFEADQSLGMSGRVAYSAEVVGEPSATN